MRGRAVSLISKHWQVNAVNLQFPVSKQSKFIDGIWDFNTPNNERLNSVTPAKLMIKWNVFYDVIPPRLVDAVKVLAFVYSMQVKLTSNNKKQFKPLTVCSSITKLLWFISHVILSGKERFGISPIESIFDINAIDIERGVQESTLSNLKVLKNLFKRLTEPEILNEIKRITDEKSDLGWTLSDLKLIKFPEHVAKNTARTIPLPDHLVYFLVSNASSDVCWLLSKLGVEPMDRSYLNNQSKLRFMHVPNIKEAFEDYTSIRKIDSDKSVKYQLRTSYSCVQRKKFVANHKISVVGFLKEIERVQKAARYLILQFTGARYSESISFKTGCIFKNSNQYFVKGTVIKGRNTLDIAGNDYWVAIPIVRDAVKVLEVITQFTYQEYLFSKNYRPILKVDKRALSLSSVNNSLNRYLSEIDIDRKYSSSEGRVLKELLLSTHRIRTTLANQLIKQKSGLLVIAYQFHHAYMALKLYNIPSESTMGYGNISNEILNNATANEKVRLEIVDSIYSPNATLAGGGAAAFIERRSDFFSGEFRKGKSLSTILKDLSKKKLAFADVNLGFCGGKEPYLNEEGIKEEPPCIGQMKCNPNRCKNAVIPKNKVPHWKAYLNANKKMVANPQFAYAKENLEYHISEAENVLKILEGGNS